VEGKLKSQQGSEGTGEGSWPRHGAGGVMRSVDFDKATHEESRRGARGYATGRGNAISTGWSD